MFMVKRIDIVWFDRWYDMAVRVAGTLPIAGCRDTWDALHWALNHERCWRFEEWPRGHARP